VLPTVPILAPQHPDAPVSFGFKTTWWAVPCPKTDRVVAAIGLQNTQPANWHNGIKFAYDRFVFVTPPINDWTLIAGSSLPPISQNARDEVIEPLIELSKTFGAAFVFATHRVVDYHLWAKAAAGSLIRGYGYLGESGETFWDEGPMTPEERKLGFAFFDERSPEAEDDAYWERSDLDFADEKKVMDIAREWSISPCDLEHHSPKEQVLGVLGSHSDLLNTFPSARAE
jgi:hypothetical protein